MTGTNPAADAQTVTTNPVVTAPTAPNPQAPVPPEPAAPTAPTPTDAATAPLGEPGLKALQDERDARKALEKQVAELQPLAEQAKKLQQANQTEAERLAAQLAEAQQSGTEAAQNLAKLQAAMAAAPAGTDPQRIADLASRLRGETPDELQADAAQLFTQLGVASTVPPAGAATAPSTTPVENLQPGAMPTPAAGPTLAEQIAAAEQAGNYQLAIELKTRQLADLHTKQT